MALPMSWHSEATTTSWSAPARSARVAVCRQWVSWSVANPSVILLRLRSSSRIISGVRDWFCSVSRPISIHCSWVDSSMRVKVSVMPPSVAPPPQTQHFHATERGKPPETWHENREGSGGAEGGEHVAGLDLTVVGQGAGALPRGEQRQG